MTGVVLALAGLAAGDSGPGLGATRAPVGVRLTGNWEGTIQWGETEPEETTLEDGLIDIILNRRALLPCRIIADGDLKAQVTIYGSTNYGVCRIEPGRVLIAYGSGRGKRPTSVRPGDGTILLTLRPAAPRKP